MKTIFILLLLGVFAITHNLKAQILEPVKWEITSKKVSDGLYEISCKATIDNEWHVYDTDLPEGGPIITSFNIDEDETSGIEVVGKFKATTEPTKEYSDAFEMELKHFSKTVTFVQQVKVTQPKGKLVGYVEFMACRGGECIPPAEADFEFDLTK